MTERLCVRCGGPIARHYRENQSTFAARLCCSKRCAMLYANARRWPTLSPEEIIRQRSKLDPATGCWNWTGPTHSHQGYGRVGYDGRYWVASRLSYVTFVGDLPEGMFACHRCDNPSCVNPDHLFAGTLQDNVDDMLAKGRGGRGVPKLSAEDVAAIRASTERQSLLARRYGVVATTIANIRNGVSWRNINPTGGGEP